MLPVVEQETKTFSVKQGREIVVRMKNRTGILWELAKLLSAKGLNVLALNGAVCGEDCVVRLMTDDDLRAKDVLEAHHYAPQEEGVLVMELAHRPGMLKRMAETLAKGRIDIRHIYATAGDDDENCLLVLHSSNDDHAMVILKQFEIDSFEGTSVSEERQVDQQRNANMVSEGAPLY